MKALFSSILIIDSIIAFYLFLSPIWERTKLDAANRSRYILSLASGIWSLGFGMLFLQTDVEQAYFWRSFAVFGTVLYMISVQFLICQISGISKRLQGIFNLISITGFIPYLLSIQKNQTEYFMSAFGMTYSFVPGIVNNIYTTYFLLVSANILGIIIYMIRFSPKKRLQTFGKRFLLVTILILLGTVLDMIFPALGFPALPGSNVTQFWGLVILFYAMDVINRSRINVANMSEFIYHSLAVPVLVFDENHKLRITNEAANSFLSIPSTRDDLSDYIIEYFFVLHSHAVFSFEEPHYGIDATCRINNRPCNLTISKIDDDYGDTIGYIVIIKDLSERMQYIKELEKARQEADSSNRAKSQFLASMSHEIRTPMNAIIGFSELALQENPSPALADYLEDIKGSSHNLMSIINDILDISKIESGKMELVNVEYHLGDLLHDVYEIILTQAAQKGLDFQIELDEKLPSVLLGDANRLRSILLNLLNNSVKYTPTGFIKLNVSCSGAHISPFILTLRVSDSGIGIKEEELPKLFESFTQVDQAKNYGKEGTGLGLALVKGFCDLMNGNVSVSSVYGEGTTFTAVVEQSVVDATPLDLKSIKSGQIKDDFSIGTLKVHDVDVLIVDDNPVNCKVISRSLSFYGMNVDIATNGADSIVMCQNKKYNLVFMDQMMPEMDGIEAMRRIRQSNPYYNFGNAGKIIVLTANAISGVKDELLAEGFDEYLSKPINFRDFEKILYKFLPERIYKENDGADTILPTSSTKPEISPVPVLNEVTVLLPNVKVENGISHCGGNLDNYLEILQMVYETSPNQLTQLAFYLSNRNWKDFAIYAHAIKGTCLNIGASECGEKAKALEHAGKQEDSEFIHANYEDFIAAYSALLTAIESVLKKFDMFSKNSEAVSPDAQFEEIMAAYRSAVSSFDFANASSLLREAHTIASSKLHTELLNQLDVYMEDLDVDAILELLRK